MLINLKTFYASEKALSRAFEGVRENREWIAINDTPEEIAALGEHVATLNGEIRVYVHRPSGVVSFLTYINGPWVMLTNLATLEAEIFGYSNRIKH